MPSCSISLGLLVLLGGVLASARPVQGPKKFVSDKLKEIHKDIASELNLTQLEINQDPPFEFVIKTINTSCQSKDIQLLNTTLDVYTRIFSNILHHYHDSHHGRSQTPGLLDSLTDDRRSKVLSDVKKLKSNMEHLKSHLTCKNPNIEDALSQLDNIQVDDPMVQKKALAQFLEIYQAASTVAAASAASAA